MHKLILTLIFITSFLQAWSQTDPFQITFEVKKTEWVLIDLLKEIQSQTGLDMSYSSSQLDLTQKIMLTDQKLKLGQFFEYLESSASLKAIRQGNKILIVKNYLSAKETSGKGSLSGFVRDANTGEKLIGANVLLSHYLKGCNTDLNGYFYIDWPLGDVDFKATISYVGYKDLTIDLGKGINLQSDFYMQAGSSFAPVIIYDNNYTSSEEMDESAWSPGKQSKIQFIPGSFGGIDIFREMALLPGVIKTTDLQSGVSIRGFGSAQTNYLIDGIHLYEPNHSFGLFSVFNHQAVSHVELFKQDIPFEYSGRISGVVQHELKNGSINKWQGNIGLNAAAMDLTLDGPLIQGKTSMMISGRKSLIDAYLPQIVRKFNAYQNPSVDFYDFNLKITHHINPRHKVEIMSLQYSDRIFFEYQTGERILRNQVKWGSNLGGIRWNGVFGNKLSMFSQFAWSNFSNYKNVKTIVLLTSQDTVGANILGQSQIKDLIWHNHAKYYFSNELQLKAGIKSTLSRLRPSLYRKINFDIDDLSPFLDSGKDSLLLTLDAYADLNYILNEQLTIGTGLQVNTLISKMAGPKYHLNPVFRFFYRPIKQHQIHLSIQKLTQSHHLLMQNSYGLSSDFWLPASTVLPAEYMWQFALDYSWQVNRHIAYQFSTYYRLASDLPAFKNPGDQYDPVLERGPILPVFTDSGNWVDKVTTHEAESYGVEQELRWKWKQFTLIMAYSLGKTDYSESASGKTFSYPGDFDVRHAGNIFLKFTNKSGLNSYASWQYHSGRPVSLPVDSYLSAAGTWILNYGEKNAWRIAPYHALDLGISGQRKTEEWVLDFAIGFTNLYNHQNPVGTKLYLEDNTFSIRQINGFPCLPYLRLNLFIR